MAGPEEHSDLVGGSTAGRRIACPGSYQLEKKVPESVRNASSSYADEGTALHAAMNFILTNNLISDELEEAILGREFEGYVITRELMDDAIYPCVDFFDALCQELEDAGEGDVDILVEQRCQMPGIPGAFGTADVIFKTNRRAGVIDWKFGVGVPVKAAYPDPVDPSILVPNAQLMFYGRAARDTYKHMFEPCSVTGKDVDLYIVQPRCRFEEGEDIFTKVSVSLVELEDYRVQLLRAVSEAKGDNPRIRRGDHCRFAPCKVICPAHTNPVLDLTKMHEALGKKKTATVLGGIDIDWPQMYSELLTLADLAELVISEVRAQAHVFMSDGNVVPGYKLVPKRANETYVDEASAKDCVRHAVGLGVDPKDAFNPPEIKSPAQLRAVIAEKLPGKTKKAREEAAKEEMKPFTQKVSSGTTIATDDDNRPNVIPSSSLLLQLADRLSSLTDGDQHG